MVSETFCFYPNYALNVLLRIKSTSKSVTLLLFSTSSQRGYASVSKQSDFLVVLPLITNPNA